jgi:hypothetical protein
MVPTVSEVGHINWVIGSLQTLGRSVVTLLMAYKQLGDIMLPYFSPKG